MSLIKLFSDGKIKQETNDEERERERERESKNRKIFEIDKKVASFLDEQPDLANTCQTNFKCSLTESFFCNLIQLQLITLA